MFPYFCALCKWGHALKTDTDTTISAHYCTGSDAQHAEGYDEIPVDVLTDMG
jgi:hypothetical protein